MSYVMKLTPEQRLQKCVSRIMRYPGLEALWGVMLIGTRSIVDDVPTACTDGVNERYGRKFVEELTDAEFCGVILHEVFHKMFKHLIVWAVIWKKNPRAANAAMDYVINLLIHDICEKSDGKFKLPKGALLDEQYRDMNVLQVFRLLVNGGQRPQTPPPGEGGKPCDSGDDGKGKGQPQPGDDGKGKGQPQPGDDIPEGHDTHDWENAQERGDDENQKIGKQIEEAVRQGQMLAEKRAREAGNEGGGLNSALEEYLNPKTDWRQVLREFVRQHCRGITHSTWRTPKRRHAANGLYLPSNYSIRVEDIMDACDTSGSMWGFRSHVRSELLAIADQIKPKTMRHLDWDTSVTQDVTIQKGRPTEVKKIPVIGGGGTDVGCIPQYLKSNKVAPKVLIIMTDGIFHGWGKDWPKGTKVLWLIFGNRNVRPPFGRVVHVDETDFDRIAA